MQAAVTNIRANQANVPSQMILERLIERVSFPIDQPKVPAAGQIETARVRLPKNKSEVLLALDSDLELFDQCLANFVEFKRGAVQLIFDQFRDQPGINGVLGDQDENLET